MNGTIHETIQDRIPEVARGHTEWGAEALAHLASCAECAAEWELIRAATGVGALVERDFDAAGAALAVTARLRQERPIHRRPWVPTLIGLTAAAAIVLVLYRPTAPAPAPVSVVEGRLFPALDSLDTEELTIIADGLETPLAETPLGAPYSLDDLDSTQLARVLRALEG